MHRPVPHAVFAGCVGLYLLLAGCALWSLHQRPWMGLELERAGDGYVVTGIDAHGPAAGQDLVGRRLYALAGADGVKVRLDPRQVERDPDHWRTWVELAAARETLDNTHRALRSGRVELELDDGERHTLLPAPNTPLHALGWPVAVKLMVGLASFLCAASVFAFRPERDANRYFALAGAMVLAQVMAAAAIEAPRIGMSAVQLERLFSLMHLADFGLITAIAALAGSHPARLAVWKRMRTVGYGLAALAAWLDLLDLGERPGLVHRVSLGLGLALIVFLLFSQWRHRRPGGRRSGQAVAPALLALVAADALVSLVPTWAGWVPWMGQGEGAVGLNLAYVALGVMIYRGGLMDVDRWMVGAWLTFFTSLAMLVVDALVVMAAGRFGSWQAAMLSVFVLAWLYLPLRQALLLWLARRHPQRDLRGVAPLLFRRMLAPHARTAPDQAWRELLAELFAPLHLTRADDGPERPTLLRGGLEMRVPATAGLPPLLLRHADRGNRLFTGRDLELASHLGALADRVHRFRDALQAGARAERSRIAQDLHDEVIPPLLSLIYRAQDREVATQARAVLRELREILRDLDAGPSGSAAPTERRR